MNKRIAAVVVIFALVLFGVIGFKTLHPNSETNTYSGTIEGTEIPVQPEQGGRIFNLSVHEGQFIKTGDIIAKLDPAQAQIALATAQSQQSQAQAKLNDLLGGTRSEEIRRLQNIRAQTQANAGGLAQNLQFEENNLANAQKLFASGAMSKQELDVEQNKFDTVKAQLEAAQASVNAAQASLDQALAGYTQPTIQAQKAAVDMADQGVKTAELALSKLTIKSPVSGQVLYQNVQTGQVVNPGMTLVTLLDPSDLWVKVYVPETKLNQVKVGETAYVAVDAYPGKKFKGQIEYISDQAEFTPKNVQTKEERTTTVFAVKISITEGKDQLKSGMPADVTLQ